MLNRGMSLLLLCGLLFLQVSQAQEQVLPEARFDTSEGTTLMVMERNKQAQVCVVLSSEAIGSDMVRVQIANTGTATSDVDFIDSDVDLMFNVGDTKQCANFTILDDEIEEGDIGETIVLQIVPVPGQQPDNLEIIFDLFTILIMDSDVLLIGFTQPVYEVMEGESQEVCVGIMNNITLAENVDVRVTVRPDAVSGEHSLSTSSLVLSSGPSMQVCLDVTIIDDDIIESTETFELILEQDDLEVRFDDNTATIRILDNDGAIVELNQTTYELVEGDLSTFMNATVCVILSDDRGGLDRDIIINVTTASDNATSGVDFVPIESMLTIPRGSQILAMDTRTCLEFSVIGDDQREFDEFFTIIFTPFTEDEFGDAGAVVTVTIQDDNDTLDCRTLLGPDKGAVNQQGSIIGSNATYTCNDNFALEPEESQTRTCQANDWSGSDPVCVARCRSLDVDSGSVQMSDVTVMEGTVIRYVCFENYEIEGNENRTCQANGRWSGTDPTCEAIMCGNLGNPENGGVSFSSRRVDSMATYSCRDGFDLLGSQTRVCRSDSLWDGVEPICNGAMRVTFASGWLVTLTTIILVLLTVLIL